MGYVFNYNESQSYEKWCLDEPNKIMIELETKLMMQLLKPHPRESVLDIGCGTGISLVPFIETGLQVTGIDPSPAMLDIAYCNVRNKADLYRGFSEDLPFEDNSFNYTSFFTSLEFVDDPEQAIAEAARVAKDRIFIGILNKYALTCFQRRIKGLFTNSIYNKARFFSIWEIKQIIKKCLGDVPIVWRALSYHPTSAKKLEKIEALNNLSQRLPFGAFIGIVISLVPRFRTRPLIIKYEPQQTSEVLVGCAGRGRMRIKE
ncbi:MAG: methyltransferase domain-containing protein [Desulfobacterales bacterium]|nr:methyltransferase domain-containing protein [Desulfobacterales bacterium]